MYLRGLKIILRGLKIFNPYVIVVLNTLPLFFDLYEGWF
jgi:hypothetical protein